MPDLCRAFGLIVETEMPIPGAMPLEALPDAKPRPDVVVRTGPARLGAGEGPGRGGWGPYRVGAEGLLFEQPGVARFLCDPAGESVSVESSTGADREEVAAYLVATVLPAVLWTRGDLMMHGAAAVLPGEERAVVLAGSSGVGKSTVLEAIVAAGGDVVAEDSLCVRMREGGVEGSGLPACLHLRSPGAALGADRQVAAVPWRQCRASAKLGAVVVLEPVPEASMSGSAGLGLTKLTGADALLTLLRHQHRPRIPWLLGRSGHLLPLWAAVAQAVPVYSLKFRRAAPPSTDGGMDWRTLAMLA